MSRAFFRPDRRAALALDTKHESWNVLWGIPKSRSIAAGSTLRDTVTVRCEGDNSYRPGNLTLTNGVPDSSYGMARVVSKAALSARS